jgi:glutamyl-tRNA synthetase
LDDKVLFKSADRLPTYHLANIVDDRLMEITHVIRGEEWLPSAPLHILLYRCFGWEAPQFAHLPLLLKPDGNGKLSKRDGDRLGFPVFPLEWKDPKSGETSSGYRESGYLPEAVVNFLALLGWNPGDDREILSIDELIPLFSLEKCSKSGAKFDYEKARWFNHQYIQRQSDEVIAELFLDELAHCKPGPVYEPYQMPAVSADNTLFYKIAQKAYQDKVFFDKTVRIAGLVKERINFIHELWEQTYFFFIAPETYDEKTVQKRWKEDSAKQMTELTGVLDGITGFSAQQTEEAVKSWIETRQYHLGNVMNAFRLALVGASKGPHLFDITEILGKEETIERLQHAIRVLK